MQKTESELSKKELMLIIPDQPVAKKRPRFCIHQNRFVGVYDEQTKFILALRYIISSQMAANRILKPFEGPLSVDLTFYTQMPKSWSESLKTRKEGHLHWKRPDIDNYVKLYLDAMNKLVYADDGQVAQLTCKKKLSQNPRVIISVKKIEEHDD